jgi:hypothetical protein
VTLRETYEAVEGMIHSDGWTLVLMPALKKQHAFLLNQIINSDPYAPKAVLIAQLSTVRFFLEVAANNEKLADRLAEEDRDAISIVPFVAGSPYDLPREVL